MIVVVADDLSGAAELAGASRALGCQAEVQTRFHPRVAADVVCVDAGTRSLTPPEAARVAAALARAVVDSGPEWVYLKFDSVLRGNVRVELRAAMVATGRERAILVPANPARGRVIRDGVCLIDGIPLDATSFAADPEHPRRSARVLELLGGDSTGIAIPDVEHPADLVRLAAGVGSDTLRAGGVEFFAALLKAGGASGAGGPTADAVGAGGESARRPVTLVVCGSLASWATRRGEAFQRGIPTFDLSAARGAPEDALKRDGAALLGIGAPDEALTAPPGVLVAALAECVARVAATFAIDRLLLEGGATAAAVVRRLGWDRLRAVAGGGAGVGALRPVRRTRPTLYIKPGSYAWPPSLW